jgi:hypothetical protein
MGFFTDYLKDKIIGHIFGKAVLTPPNIYLALSSSLPDEDGNNFSEPAGSGYHRFATTAANWTDPQAGALTNVTRICMDMACGDWGIITHFGLFDAQQGGHLLLAGVLQQSLNVVPGAIVNFEQGQLCINLV